MDENLGRRDAVVVAEAYNVGFETGSLIGGGDASFLETDDMRIL